jgi:hypothetical protein
MMCGKVEGGGSKRKEIDLLMAVYRGRLKQAAPDVGILSPWTANLCIDEHAWLFD